MNHLISIIIPIYNREAYIQECILSIQAQSYQNFEIILIDDGSTDQSISICQNMAAADNRIRLFTTSHAGVSAARNVGLSHVNGDFVFFIDSDDTIHPLLLETLVTEMLRHNTAMGGTEYLRISEKYWHKLEDHIANDPPSNPATYLCHKDTMQAFFTKPTPLGMMGGIMMRTDLIGSTRFREDLYIGEDFYFVYQNLIKGASAVFLEKKWYYGRLHANNTSWDFEYSGFMKRFFRRKLVWESEESFGRTDYANHQKRAAYYVYLDFMHRHKLNKQDRNQMHKVMRNHRKVLFPALTIKNKLQYLAYAYLPFLSPLLVQIRALLKKIFSHASNK